MTQIKKISNLEHKIKNFSNPEQDQKFFKPRTRSKIFQTQNMHLLQKSNHKLNGYKLHLCILKNPPYPPSSWKPAPMKTTSHKHQIKISSHCLSRPGYYCPASADLVSHCRSRPMAMLAQPSLILPTRLSRYPPR